jgi:hypothetical protein
MTTTTEMVLKSAKYRSHPIMKRRARHNQSVCHSQVEEMEVVALVVSGRYQKH